MLKVISVIWFVLISGLAFSQVEIADDLFENLEFRQAAKYYKNSEYLNDEQQTKYAFSLLQIHDYLNAELAFEKVVKIEDVDPVHFYYYAICLKNNKKYDLAKGYFELSKAFNPTDYFSDLNLRSMDSLEEFNKNNLPIVTSAKNTYNSAIAEFSPQVYKDGILFSKEIKYDASKKRPKIDFSTDYNDTSQLQFGTAERPLTALYYMKFSEGVFDKPELVALSEKFHIGSFSIHPKTNEIYFTKIDLINNWSTEDRSYPRLFKATIDEENKRLENIERVKVKKLSNEVGAGHPAFSKNGDKLFFASNISGGFGGSDLYVAYLLEDGSWGEPINLGSTINTYGDELFPIILNDELYFSSNGKLGYGGLDIYKAKLDGSDTLVTSIGLLGKPLNSAADDYGVLFFNETQDQGVVVSNRFGAVGDDDLFYFEPAIVETMLAGIIYDSLGNPVEGVLVKLYDEAGNELDWVKTNSKGEYEFENLADNRSYTVVATKNGFGDKETFTTDENWNNRLDLTLEPNATVQGVVLAEDGEASPNTKVTLTNEDGEVVFDGITDENGYYQFLLDSNQSYRINAQKDNLSGFKNITIDEDYNSDIDKDIVLKPSDTFVNGVIKDENGKPSSGVDVNLYDKDGNLIASTKTDENGKFHFDLEKDRNYQIEADANDFEGVDNIFTGDSWNSDHDIELSLHKKGNPGSGLITDNDTKKPISKVKVTLTDNSTGIKKVVYTDQEGVFNLRFNKDRDYTLSLEKDGYFPKTIAIEKSDKLPKEIDLNLDRDLSLTQSGFSTKGVYFGYDKYNLTTEAKEYLDQVIAKLKSNSELVVHIKSYTDCRGGDSYNKSLSWKRSRSVKQYLMSKDIDEIRILTISMGATNFINNCYKPELCSEAEHALNRRSEIEVMKR